MLRFWMWWGTSSGPPERSTALSAWGWSCGKPHRDEISELFKLVSSAHAGSRVFKRLLRFQLDTGGSHSFALLHRWVMAGQGHASPAEKAAFPGRCDLIPDSTRLRIPATHPQPLPWKL